jgi:hypothetical protein
LAEKFPATLVSDQRTLVNDPSPGAATRACDRLEFELIQSLLDDAERSVSLRSYWRSGDISVMVWRRASGI